MDPTNRPSSTEYNFHTTRFSILDCDLHLLSNFLIRIQKCAIYINCNQLIHIKFLHKVIEMEIPVKDIFSPSIFYRLSIMSMFYSSRPFVSMTRLYQSNEAFFFLSIVPLPSSCLSTYIKPYRFAYWPVEALTRSIQPQLV